LQTTKIDIRKAIDPKWLNSNGYTVILPPNKVHRVRLIAILWNNCHGDNNKQRELLIVNIAEGIERRTLQKYRGKNFAFNINTLGKKLYSDPEKIETYKKESFIVELKENETNMVRYHFRVNLKQAEEFKVKQTIKILDPVKIAKIREVEITNPAALVITDSEQIETIARGICELLGSGQVTIHEACNRHNVKYLDFARWFSTNEYIKVMFFEAIGLGSFFNTSSQNTHLDQMITQMLTVGSYTTETISYTKIFNNRNPEGIWIEDKKVIVTKQVDAKDLVMLKQIVKGVQAPNFSIDETDLMQDEDMRIELLRLETEIIKKKNAKD